MLAFDGTSCPTRRATPGRRAGRRRSRCSGYLNSGSPGQVRELTASIQQRARLGVRPRRAAAARSPPTRRAGSSTRWAARRRSPATWRCGAAGDAGLAERVGRATGLELLGDGRQRRRMPPSATSPTNPANPPSGSARSATSRRPWPRLGRRRSFAGFAAPGVAAGGKHFPGLGEVGLDTHHGLAVVDADRARLDAASWCRSGRRSRPAPTSSCPRISRSRRLTGDPTLPATLSAHGDARTCCATSSGSGASRSRTRSTWGRCPRATPR